MEQLRNMQDTMTPPTRTDNRHYRRKYRKRGKNGRKEGAIEDVCGISVARGWPL